MSTLDVFDMFSRDYARERFEVMSLRDWLLAARDDKMLYASPAERMVNAIGEPNLVDTAQDSRLSRMFFNRTIKVYSCFEGFYGMEDTIERIVGYFKHAAQGLEEKRQILYLLGPVGGGKSSLAERLKELMEKHPIYVLKAGDEISPVLESPLGLFRSAELAALLSERYGIEKHRLTGVMSPWAVKRLDQFGGDISKFEVARIYPSKLRQLAIAKTEPGSPAPAWSPRPAAASCSHRPPAGSGCHPRPAAAGTPATSEAARYRPGRGSSAPYSAPCPRRCSGSSDSSASMCTRSCLHSTASASSSRASRYVAKHWYSSPRNAASSPRARSSPALPST